MDEGSGVDAWRAKIDGLRAKLAQHPGQIATSRWGEISRSTNVFVRNARELQQLVLAGETNEELAMELVQNVRPPTVRDEYVAQLDQRLHNTLASAVSLVDHTRRLVAKYEESEFFAEFKRRNDEVRTAPEAEFLRALRNYLLHYGMAPFSQTVSFEAQGSNFESHVQIECAPLLQYSDWKAAAREYIENSGKSIRLITVINDYTSKVNGLYQWVFDQFEVLHKDDVAGANKIIEKINLTMSGGVSDGRDRPMPGPDSVV